MAVLNPGHSEEGEPRELRWASRAFSSPSLLFLFKLTSGFLDWFQGRYVPVHTRSFTPFTVLLLLNGAL